MAQMRRILIVVWVLSFCLASAAHAEMPFFTKIGVTHKDIDLSRSDKTAVQFVTARKMYIDLKIYDESRALARHIAAGELDAGRHRLEWDGRDDAGEQVVSGVYTYVLEARREPDLDPTYVHDPGSQSEGKEVFVENLVWDRKKSRISYRLPEAAYTRVRVGIKEGVFLGALRDWQPQAAGEKNLKWNGIDASGLYDLTQHADAQINVAAFALPENTIVVKSPVAEKATGSFLDTPAQPLRYRYIHARHPRALCHEPSFEVSFPSAKFRESDSVAILEGKAAVRIVIDPRDKDYLVANRFEVMFFVDGQFLYEQEEATSPLTAVLDTAQFGPGEHILTVNVMDYEDHIGARSMRITVPAAKDNQNV